MTVSKAQKKATAKYEKENYDKILLRLPKGTKERINNISGSVNGYICNLVLKDLECKELNEKIKNCGEIKVPFMD